MTYLLLDAVFLAATALVGVAALLAHRRRRPARRTRGSRLAPAIGITVAVTVLLTAVFDNVMIAAGLFSYNPDALVGVMIGRVPIEDFAYPLAAAILLPSLWILTGERRRDS
jgi:lycopene cyclase domain-containing protein